MGKNYYKILGVSRDATTDQIKRSYRKLTKQFHPDRNPDNPEAEQKFKEVQEAWEVLGDDDKRKDYDLYGEAGVGHFSTDPQGRKVYQWGNNSEIPFEDLEDLLGAFGGGASVFQNFSSGGFGGFGGFGGQPRRQRPRPMKGHDLSRQVNLSFEQAIHGTTVEVDIPDTTNDGRRGETLTVRIPQGIEDGKKIRMKGKGAPGANGGPAGDLYLVCHIRPHKNLKREGLNLVMEIPVSITEATLGAKVEIPVLDEKISISIPPGTPSGARLRLRGKGIHLKNQEGDLFVTIKIVPPKQLTDRQKELLEELDQLSNSDLREQTI